MAAKTLALTPTESSLNFRPKEVHLEPGVPVILGRQGIYASEDPSKEESPRNGYFSTAIGVLNPVSKQHASVWVDTKGKVFIQDLNSSNGTYVNGVRLASGKAKQLNTGEILRLGISLRIEHANIEMTPVIAAVNIR
ncbi:SMAD/FHA domain-containing protein [Lentinula guzmanii]|uniref:SMAD/FHA domain-containing protein n=1 Tax=Lentinula guzmanii TaxID=2804957 RepID=A0AA38J576_9AGAR|nr:SMAD/FHA domain-containing protein [Lentinula guzmanii]